MTLAGILELLPALDEAVGTPVRIDADFGFKLERANGAVDPSATGLAGKTCVLGVSGFRILPSIGPNLLERLAGRSQFRPRSAACLAARR